MALAFAAAPGDSSINSMAMSAVQSVSTSGVLVTVMPAALAAAMSMWL